MPQGHTTWTCIQDSLQRKLEQKDEEQIALSFSQSQDGAEIYSTTTFEGNQICPSLYLKVLII